MKILGAVEKVQKIRACVAFFLVGVLFVVLSCIALAQPKKELTSTDGVIERIETTFDVDGEEQDQVFVSYTDNAGVKHSDVEYPSYSSSMKQGDTVEVLYDPTSPEEIQAPGGGIIPYITLAAGIVSLLVAVVLLIKMLTRGL